MCLYVCVYVCISMCIHAYIYMYVYICMCIYVYVYIHTDHKVKRKAHLPYNCISWYLPISHRKGLCVKGIHNTMKQALFTYMTDLTPNTYK